MGLISSLIGAASNEGRNDNVMSGFGDPNNRYSSAYDPNAKNYGGQPGGVQAYNNGLMLRQGGVEGRAAPQADYTGANNWEQQSTLARGGQQQAANLMMNRATGATPSIAGQQAAQDQLRLQQQAQMDNQMLQQNARLQGQAAMAQQGAQAASARGAAGVALAGQNAANNTANAQGQIGANTANALGNMGMANANAATNISNQAQINAAQERMNAENAAFGAYTGMRGGDLGSQAQQANQAQYQATQELNSRNANDARAMGYEGLQARANEAQLNANMQDQGIKANSYNAAMGANATANQANANQAGQKAKDTAEGVGGFFDSALGGIAMLSDTRAKQSALLQRGRAEGAAAAQRGSPVIELDDADPAALDDRYRQNEVGPETVGRGALDQAIAQRVAQDRANPQRTQDMAILSRGGQANPYARFDSVNDPLPRAKTDDDAARMAWERSFGSADQAANDARMHDNAVEAQRIRDSFRQDQGSGPNAGQILGGIFGGGRAGGGTFSSDARAKEEAFLEGKRAGAVEAHQSVQNAEVRSRDQSEARASKNLLQSVMSPAHMAASVASLPSAMAANENAVAAAERARLAGRVPNTVKTEPKRGLVIERGPDRVGVPSKAMTEEQMFTQPSELKTPVQWDYNSAQPLATRGTFESDERAKNIDRGPVAGANRAMRGEPYTYKEEFTPPNEKEGQPHYGFMAQNLEKNPVSATAVEKGPDGMKVVDRDRLLQVVAAGVSDLQRQQDETRKVLLKRGGRR